MRKEISGVILAGGTGKRFGGITKSKILINGKPIINRMTDVMQKIFDEIIIVTNTPDDFEEFTEHKIVRDKFIKTGPLGGIHAAMEASSKDAVFVFAGDMPFISREVIADQIKTYSYGDCDALVPKISSYIEPLHAIYNNSVYESLIKYLMGNGDFAVRDFLKYLNVNYVKMEDTEEIRFAFTNINTPRDLLQHENHNKF